MFPNACTLLFFQNALKGAWKQLQRDDAYKRFLWLACIDDKNAVSSIGETSTPFQDLVFILLLFCSDVIRVFEIVGYVDVLLPRPLGAIAVAVVAVVARHLWMQTSCRSKGSTVDGQRARVGAEGCGRGKGRREHGQGTRRDRVASPEIKFVPYVENSSRLPQNRAEFLQLRMRPDR